MPKPKGRIVRHHGPKHDTSGSLTPVDGGLIYAATFGAPTRGIGLMRSQPTARDPTKGVGQISCALAGAGILRAILARLELSATSHQAFRALRPLALGQWEATEPPAWSTVPHKRDSMRGRGRSQKRSPRKSNA